MPHDSSQRLHVSYAARVIADPMRPESGNDTKVRTSANATDAYRIRAEDLDALGVRLSLNFVLDVDEHAHAHISKRNPIHSWQEHQSSTSPTCGLHCSSCVVPVDRDLCPLPAQHDGRAQHCWEYRLAILTDRGRMFAPAQSEHPFIERRLCTAEVGTAAARDSLFFIDVCLL
jgi:hypothetical protein